MSIGVAYLASVWCKRRTVPARLLIAVLLAVMGLEASLAVARSRHVLAVLLGRESAAEFLARREPTFTVGRWAARNLPSDARLIGQDHRGFYIPRDYTMELAHRRRTGLGHQRRIAGEIVAKLCESGFTHVMFCPPVPETAVEFDPTLGRLLAPWIAGQDAALSPKTSPTATASCGNTRSTSCRRPVPSLDPHRSISSHRGRAGARRDEPLAADRRRAEGSASRKTGIARSATGWRGGLPGRRRFTAAGWRSGSGLSAHQVTLAALVLVARGRGGDRHGRSRFCSSSGVMLAHLGFWLDHVDGQVARWRGTVSLDGVYFDYLMHHAANLALGFALGYGLAARSGETRWTIAGFAIAVGWALLSLHNDCRYKAFFQRLKSATGSYRVDGGGGGRPQPPAPWPRRGRAAITWPAYKLCEIHVVLMGLTVLAVLAIVFPPVWLATLAEGRAVAGRAGSLAGNRPHGTIAAREGPSRPSFPRGSSRSRRRRATRARRIRVLVTVQSRDGGATGRWPRPGRSLEKRM